MSRMAILESEIGKANQDFEAIVISQLDDLNNKLKSKKLEPITLLTEEEFEKRED